MPTYDYVARHFNEDPLFFGNAYAAVAGTPLDTADGDTSYIEVSTPAGGDAATTTRATFRWQAVGADAPPVNEWTKAVISMGGKHVSGSLPGAPTVEQVYPGSVIGLTFGQDYFPDYPDVASTDGYTITSSVLLPTDLTVDGGFPDPLGPNTYWIAQMYGDIDGAVSRFTYLHLSVITPDPPPPPPPTMGRPHIHLPITKANGDLLLFADVSLIDPDTGAEVTPKTYSGPLDVDNEITWPVTFAPANVDLWLDEPGRYDLRVVGPDGYSTIVRSVDFAPAAPNQAATAAPVQIASVPQPRRWLQGDSDKQARFKDPGLIAPHDHDSGPADSTILGSGIYPRIYSDDVSTRAGYQSGGDETSIGYSTTGGTGSAVVGASSGAGVGGTSLGDQHVSPPDGQTTLTQGATGAESAYVKPDEVALRGMASTAAEDQIGASTKPATPAGVTHPVWLLGDGVVDTLSAPNNVVLGGAGDVVSFYGVDGATQGPHLTGATGVLADLITALEGLGVLANA